MPATENAELIWRGFYWSYYYIEETKSSESTGYLHGMSSSGLLLLRFTKCKDLAQVSKLTQEEQRRRDLKDVYETKIKNEEREKWIKSR